jgi:signal transduction histidine kinase
MNSLQHRLGLGLIAALLVVGLILLQASLWLFEAGLRRSLETDLREETEGLLVALVPGPDGLQLDSPRLGPRYQRAFSGHYFRIDSDNRDWRSRSLWDSDLDWPVQDGLHDALIDGPQEQRLLIYRAEYRRGGQRVHISVAHDYTPMLDSFRQVRLGGLALLGLALLAFGLLQRMAIRAALRPLESARGQIAELQQGRRAQLDTRVPQELQPLVTQINHLLTQTDETLKRSRHAIGNLGHALKTPLAVLAGLLDSEALAGQPALRQQLEEQLGQIRQRVSRELSRARLAGEGQPGGGFDCAQELPALFTTLAAIHRRGLAMDWQAPPDCRLPWEREDVLELLGNLLDNACKWARSQVRLSIETSPDGYWLRVDDDGPGIPAERRDAVCQRGTRLDEGFEGHGLGLGIVADIISAWRGEWHLQDSPLGGLRVEIRLPCVSPGR